MGERHIKEKQRINQVLDIGGEKLSQKQGELSEKGEAKNQPGAEK